MSSSGAGTRGRSHRAAVPNERLRSRCAGSVPTARWPLRSVSSPPDDRTNKSHWTPDSRRRIFYIRTAGRWRALPPPITSAIPGLHDLALAPRHLFDLAIGADNLLRTDKAKLRVRFSVLNLTNKEALYNFLSTFSGTHFVTPRAFQVQAGVTF